MTEAHSAGSIRVMPCRKCSRMISIKWPWKFTNKRSSWGWWVCAECAAFDWAEHLMRKARR